MTQYETPEKAPQAVSRLGLYLAPGLLFLISFCCSCFWLYGSQKAEEALASWMAAEKTAGRNWNCADKVIGGYPFRIELNCSSIKVTTANLRAELGSFHAVAQIYSPKLALADVSGPFQIDSAGSLSLWTWSSMRISARFGRDLERLSITVAEFKPSDPTDTPVLMMETAELHLRTDTARSTEDRAVDFALRLDGIRSSNLDALIGNQEAGLVELNGTLTQTLGLRANAWQSLLENWRSQNGQLLLEASRISKGNFAFEGKGVLGLDPSHRIQGELAVGIRGASPLLAHFVPRNTAQLAGALLERKDGSAVQMPLRFQDSRFFFGPLRSGPVLTPLY